MAEKRVDPAGQSDDRSTTPPREQSGSRTSTARVMEKRKSQTQQIIEGSSVTRKRYGIRSQPLGPQPQTKTPNAAKLSSVASSSEEKYRGGQD